MEPIKTRTPDSILFFGTGSRCGSVWTLCARCACVAIHIIAQLLYTWRPHSNVYSKRKAKARVNKKPEAKSEDLNSERVFSERMGLVRSIGLSRQSCEHNETIKRQFIDAFLKTRKWHEKGKMPEN